MLEYSLALDSFYSVGLFVTAELKVSISMCRVTALTRASAKSIANTIAYSSGQRQATWCIADQAAMSMLEE